MVDALRHVDIQPRVQHGQLHLLDGVAKLARLWSLTAHRQHELLERFPHGTRIGLDAAVLRQMRLQIGAHLLVADAEQQLSHAGRRAKQILIAQYDFVEEWLAHAVRSPH